MPTCQSTHPTGGYGCTLDIEHPGAHENTNSRMMWPCMGEHKTCKHQLPESEGAYGCLVDAGHTGNHQNGVVTWSDTERLPDLDIDAYNKNRDGIFRQGVPDFKGTS